MLKITNQNIIRKVQTVIQSLRPRHSNHNSNVCQDQQKHRSFYTCLLGINVVNDLFYVKLHELLGTDASYHLFDVVPKRADQITVEEVVLSVFSKPVTTGAIRHVCQARFEGKLLCEVINIA